MQELERTFGMKDAGFGILNHITVTELQHVKKMTTLKHSNGAKFDKIDILFKKCKFCLVNFLFESYLLISQQVQRQSPPKILSYRVKITWFWRSQGFWIYSELLAKSVLMKACWSKFLRPQKLRKPASECTSCILSGQRIRNQHWQEC